MTAILLVVSLIVTFTVVLVLVGYLIGVIVALWGTHRGLTRLVAGLVAIRDHTEPLGGKLDTLNGGLSTLRDRLLAVNGDLGAIVQVTKKMAATAR